LLYLTLSQLYLPSHSALILIEDSSFSNLINLAQNISQLTIMPLIASIPVGVVAAIHVYILNLEMFLWTKPRGLKAFGMKPDYAAKTAGLYNGFLAAGLAWGIAHPQVEVGKQIQLFFLGCVGIAGVYGGLTVKRAILWIQAVPAAIAAGAVLLA
jgi:putative membrane protein